MERIRTETAGDARRLPCALPRRLMLSRLLAAGGLQSLTVHEADTHPRSVGYPVSVGYLRSVVYQYDLQSNL